MKKKKILVTGGCGFIGTNLCVYLKKKHYLVYSLDNLSRKGSIYNFKLLRDLKIKNFKFDIFNFKKINSLPKFDLIIDCCAEAAVEISRKDIDRVVNTNLIGTFNILKKAKKDNSKIIFLSSSRVNSIKTISKMFQNHNFKNQLKIRKTINENFDTNSPKSIYGLTKHVSEMFIEEFSFAFNLKYIINRLGVVSGPLQFGKQDQGFVSLWIWRHITKKKLKYIGFGGFGNQVRDVLHINDLCKIIEIQIKNLNTIFNKTFTIGGSLKNSISLKKLTKICQKITNNKVKFTRIKKTSLYDITLLCN
jgi:CDP-paratose 2-epimerase